MNGHCSVTAKSSEVNGLSLKTQQQLFVKVQVDLTDLASGITSVLTLIQNYKRKIYDKLE